MSKNVIHTNLWNQLLNQFYHKLQSFPIANCQTLYFNIMGTLHSTSYAEYSET